MRLIFRHFIVQPQIVGSPMRPPPPSSVSPLFATLRRLTTREMPTIAKLPSGSRRARIRREGRHVSEAFLRRDGALRWARLAELAVDRNETPVSSRIARPMKFEELAPLRIEDMVAVGRPPRRSKAATLDMLKHELGTIRLSALDRASMRIPKSVE